METIDRIFAQLNSKGVKQIYLCEQLGVDKSWLRTVKKQGSNISDERLARIADILDTTIEYLKGETDNPEKEKSPSKLDELLAKPDINELLELYRALTPAEQRKALSVLKALKETE